MDSWNEPISFASNGKPNDSLSKYEAQKEKLKKAPLQINNDGSVTPLNQDGSPLDGSSYKRPEMSEESEGWKLKDKNAFNGKYDDVMDLDGPPSSLKGFIANYVVQGEVKDWGYSAPVEEHKTFKPSKGLKNSPSPVPGKLVVQKIMPDGSLMHEKTYEPGEIVNLNVDQSYTNYPGDDGLITASYPAKIIYTVETAHEVTKYSIPPFKMTYTLPVKEKAPEVDIDEALAVAAELPVKESPQSWTHGATSQQIVDAIKATKKAYEAPQPEMSPAGLHALKAMSFAQIYGAGTQKQAEMYKKYLTGQFNSTSPAPTYKVPAWEAASMPLSMPPVDPSEYEEESDDDEFYDDL